jgi:hypothetical protein
VRGSVVVAKTQVSLLAAFHGAAVRSRPDARGRGGSDDRFVAAIPQTRLPARRRRRGAHPTTGEPLRLRVLGERERIGRLSRIRELVLGFQDGLLVPLAVVTGLAGANAAASTVLVGGLAEAVAGAVAMGTGRVSGQPGREPAVPDRDRRRGGGGASATIGYLIGSLMPD